MPMTICAQCNGKGATYPDTEAILDAYANTNVHSRESGVISCSQCGGKGYLPGMGF